MLDLFGFNATVHSFTSSHRARCYQTRLQALTVRSVTLALLSPALVVSALGVSAQTLSSINPSQMSNDLGEVVVTAGLRQSSAADLSASTTVLNAQDLHDSQVRHLEDALTQLPNVNWAGDTQRPRYFQIRGLGELEEYQGAPNPSVGVLIDDMDVSSIAGIASLTDVDQVDVYRGPQGTRLGANALAGLIYIRSHEPTSQFELNTRMGVGNENTTDLESVANLPLSASQALRIAFEQLTSNGAYQNATLGRDDTNGRHEQTLRGSWSWAPHEDIQLRVHALHVDLKDGYDAWSPIGGRTTYSDQPGQDDQLTNGVSVDLTAHGPRDQFIELIHSDVSSHMLYSFDGDWGSAAYWAPYIDQFTDTQQRARHTQTSDLRWGQDQDTFNGWRVGLYRQSLTESLTDLSVGHSFDPINGDYQQNVTTDSIFKSISDALYGQWDHTLAHTLHVSAGLRVEHHYAKYADSVQDAIADTTDTHQFDPNDHLWGGHLELSAPATFGEWFIKVARGYKASGFNPSSSLPVAALTFKPESDLNTEAGINTEWLHGHLHWNTDVFVMNRTDAQIKTSYQADPTNPNTFVFYTGNAQSANHRGLESQLSFAITPQLSAHAQIGLLHTQFTDFQLLTDGNQSVSRELANAPHVSYSTDLTFKPTDEVFARIEVSGMSSFYYDLPPNNTQSQAYALTHLSFGWQHAQWETTLSVRNLFDKDYTVRGFYFGLVPPNYTPALYTQLGEPRLMMFNVNYRFNKGSSH